MTSDKERLSKLNQNFKNQPKTEINKNSVLKDMATRQKNFYRINKPAVLNMLGEIAEGLGYSRGFWFFTPSRSAYRIDVKQGGFTLKCGNPDGHPGEVHYSIRVVMENKLESSGLRLIKREDNPYIDVAVELYENFSSIADLKEAIIQRLEAGVTRI